MAQRTLAAGFTDTGIEKAAAKSAPAGKNEISVNPVIPSTKPSAKSAKSASNFFANSVLWSVKIGKILWKNQPKVRVAKT